MPSAAASLCSDSGRSSPVPLGPPTTATSSRSRQLRLRLEQRARPRAAARRAPSAAGCARRTAARTASGGSPSRVRAADASAIGRNSVQVDAGRDRDDLVRVGAVEADAAGGPRPRCWRSAGRPRPTTCSSPMSRASGSGRSPSASEAFLTLARVCVECTSGTPQRVRGQPADLAGQPVVRVHQVVPAGLVGGLGPQHLGGERAQLGRQVVLGQPLERAGDDVPDQHAGLSSTTGGSVAATWPG